MITSKVLALSLLLISPLALARVQIHMQAELKNVKQHGNHNTDITFQIDAHESLEVYNHGNVKIVAELLAEEETTAITRFTMYGRNDADEYEIISTPVISSNYTNPGVITMDSTDGETFTMTIQAQKI